MKEICQVLFFQPCHSEAQHLPPERGSQVLMDPVTNSKTFQCHVGSLCFSVRGDC